MKNKYIILWFVLSTIFVLKISAQEILWQNNYGGSEADFANSIICTNDNGYIIIGTTSSEDADIENYHGFGDVPVIKTDSSGIVEWQKAYGGTSSEQAHSICQTNDEGFIFTGFTYSSDGDITYTHNSISPIRDDFWVVKLNPLGDIQWQKCIGGSGFDAGYSIVQAHNNGYIVVGESRSSDGDIPYSLGSTDGIVAKLSLSGDIEWIKVIGGSFADHIYSIVLTSDGGYILAGSTESNDGNISTNNGGFDAWIVKLDSLGNIQWEETYGGTKNDGAEYISQTYDKGYIITGEASSNDGDVIGYHDSEYTDIWILKLDSIGTLMWQKCLGGSSADWGNSIIQSEDSAYIVAGYSHSSDGDVSFSHGAQDYWIVKLDSVGYLQWEKTFGGDSTDVATAIVQNTNNDYIITGYSMSNNDDITNNLGGADIWTICISSETGIIENEKKIEHRIYPNPATDWLYFDSWHNSYVEIYSIKGQLIKTITSDETKVEINLQDLSPGTYFIKIVNDNGRTIQKLIKQ